MGTSSLYNLEITLYCYSSFAGVAFKTVAVLFSFFAGIGRGTVRLKSIGFVVSYRNKDSMSLCGDGNGFGLVSIIHSNG